MPPFITFLSDFGLQDDFVGTCHGVIKRIAPDAHVIDITHGIEPTAILEGARVLANTVPYMPVGVHLAVVDPDVGGARRPIALEDAAGRLYVGPDNGLLVPAADKLGGVTTARELTNRELWLERISRTFHGRDIFSPTAAHLASGTPFAEVGPAIDPETLIRLEVPVAEVRDGEIHARCLAVDRFGNIQLNLTRHELEVAGIAPGVRVEVELPSEKYYAIAARTFADVQPGEVVLYEDAYENVAVAITRGDAAETFAAGAGDEVRMRVV